ncbi:MAG TPA: toast rack family protein [Coriobacteriia bacterium]
MLRKMMVIALVAVLAFALIGTTGCRRVRIADRSDVVTENETVPLGGATTIEAEISMGVGELTLSGESTTTSALDGTFTYGPSDWKPEIGYDVSEGTGRLRVRQTEPDLTPDLRNAQNTWDMTLAGGVPTRISLELGVGRSAIDLRDVDVRDLSVTCGVGETTLDLSGPRTAGMDVDIEAGVGSVTVKVPRGVGVRIAGREDGVGHTSADGFIAQGGAWVNESYAGPGPKIEIDLQRGVGDVTLLLVD